MGMFFISCRSWISINTNTTKQGSSPELRAFIGTQWLSWFNAMFSVLLSVFLAFGLPRWLSSKESTCQCRRHRFDPWVGKIPWRRKWQPTPVFLPGESHGQRSLAGCSPWGHKESDMTERLTLTFYSHLRSNATFPDRPLGSISCHHWFVLDFLPCSLRYLCFFLLLPWTQVPQEREFWASWWPLCPQVLMPCRCSLNERVNKWIVTTTLGGERASQRLRDVKELGQLPEWAEGIRNQVSLA